MRLSGETSERTSVREEGRNILIAINRSLIGAWINSKSHVKTYRLYLQLLCESFRLRPPLLATAAIPITQNGHLKMSETDSDSDSDSNYILTDNIQIQTIRIQIRTSLPPRRAVSVRYAERPADQR